MSMRDFITRVLHAPIARVVAETTPRIEVETTPPIVVETTPPIVVEDDFDSLGEGSPENSVPFYWDLESRSTAILGGGKYGVGVRAYAEHPTTEVLCVGYARGNGPVGTWVPPDPIPETVLAAAADPSCPWVAHNAAFERAVLECILIPRHGWPMVPVDRHVCTMALALAHAYPGSLDGVAKILGLVNQKDVAREKIVRVMWKPRKPRRGEDPTKTYWVEFTGITDAPAHLQSARRRRRARAASASATAGPAGGGAGHVGARRRDQRSRSTHRRAAGRGSIPPRGAGPHRLECTHQAGDWWGGGCRDKE